MHWLLMYLICAIAASIIFCYIVLNDNKDYFKTHRWAGVFSIISMGAAFPLIVVVAIVKVVKAHYSTQERIRAALDRQDKIRAETQEIINHMYKQKEARAKEQERIDRLLNQLEERITERKKDMDGITSKYTS